MVMFKEENQGLKISCLGWSRLFIPELVHANPNSEFFYKSKMRLSVGSNIDAVYYGKALLQCGHILKQNDNNNNSIVIINISK